MPQVKLSPPQYSLYRQITNTIGADTCIDVERPYQENEQWYIDVHVCNTLKAQVLAAIMTPDYDFGGIKVQVRIFNPEEELVPPPVILEGDLETVKELFEIALNDNPYFVEVLEVTDKPATVPWGDLILVFTPAVIQYWNDNLADPFGYVHFVAQDLFANVLILDFPGGITVSVTTAIN